MNLSLETLLPYKADFIFEITMCDILDFQTRRKILQYYPTSRLYFILSCILTNIVASISFTKYSVILLVERPLPKKCIIKGVTMKVKGP